MTLEDIRADPEWASPYCREFIHVDAYSDPSYFEAVVVNLKLNFTFSYLGESKATARVLQRTAQSIPAIFYAFEPDVLPQAAKGAHFNI